MNIKKIMTAVKVANITKCNNNIRKKIQIEWIGDNEVLTSPNGRVYLIVVNGIIYKIGGSQAKGGIKGTWAPYINSALSGAPSTRTYGIHILIRKELNKKNKVEIYMIQSPKVKVKIPGLFKHTLKNVSPFKEMEKQCLQDYIDYVGNFPIWNFQEASKPWPISIQNQCNEIRTKCVKK